MKICGTDIWEFIWKPQCHAYKYSILLVSIVAYIIVRWWCEDSKVSLFCLSPLPLVLIDLISVFVFPFTAVHIVGAPKSGRSIFTIRHGTEVESSFSHLLNVCKPYQLQRTSYSLLTLSHFLDSINILYTQMGELMHKPQSAESEHYQG